MANIDARDCVVGPRGKQDGLRTDLCAQSQRLSQILALYMTDPELQVIQRVEAALSTADILV